MLKRLRNSLVIFLFSACNFQNENLPTFDLFSNSDSVSIHLKDFDKHFLIETWKSRKEISITFIKNGKQEISDITFDSSGNFLFYSKRDPLGHSLVLRSLKNDNVNEKLSIIAFLEKGCYKIGDSAKLFIRGGDRRYRKLSAKVYFPMDSSVYDSRPYPKIFEERDQRNSDSIDPYTLIYKFKVVRTPKNRLVIRLFCYEPKFTCELQYQSAVGDLDIPFCGK